jgi:hypothetical protein
MFLSLIIFFLLNVYIYFNSSFLALFGFLFSSHVLFHLHFFIVFYSTSFLSIFFSIRFHCLQSYNHQAPNCKFLFLLLRSEISEASSQTKIFIFISFTISTQFHCIFLAVVEIEANISQCNIPIPVGGY